MSIRIFSSDIDGTVAGDAAATTRFRDAWDALPPMEAPLLAYNTGRTIEDARQFIIETQLPDPAYIIGGVGTEIFDTDSDQMIPEYHETFGGHWDLDAIEAIMESVDGIEKQPPECLHPYKSSWFLRDAAKEHIAELETKVRESGLNACVIYSSGLDLDILPADANKGNALRWLADRVNIELDQIVVAGDSGNDTSMFFVPGVRGIAVGNAQSELLEVIAGQQVYHAGAETADGVIEGLRHFGLAI